MTKGASSRFEGATLSKSNAPTPSMSLRFTKGGRSGMTAMMKLYFSDTRRWEEVKECSPLPNGAENFTPDAVKSSFSIGQETLRRRQDNDSHSTQNFWYFLMICVDSKTRPTYSS